MIEDTPGAGPYRSIWADLRGTPLTQGWADAGDVKTRFLRSGEGPKPPLILLHGVGGHAEAYVRNLRSHGEHFSTYAIDMVGHGWSDLAARDLEVPHCVEHVLRFMDLIGAERASISGASLGGWIASCSTPPAARRQTRT